MKQTAKTIISAITAILAAISCEDKNDAMDSSARPEDLQEESTGVMTVCAEILDATIAGTRSILPEETIETMITGITVAAYSGGILADKRHYTSGFSEMSLTVNKAMEYDIYALVNMGDMTGSIPAAESGIEAVAYNVQSYKEVESSGIPMSGMLKDVRYSTGKTSIPLERLMAKLCVRILHTGLNKTENNSIYVYNLCNKSIYVRQANSRLFPFSATGSRAISASETMDESDYNANLNSREDYKGSLTSSQIGPGPGYFQDTTVVFYIPENMQGTLLPGNTDPYSKTAENISGINGTDYSGLCTYIEFTAKRENTGIGYGGSITYRYYLGSDNTTDFSIERNCRYDLTLNFSEEGFFTDSWKVTKKEDWYDSRVLKFIGKPYTIYKGYTENVMVRYNTSGSASGSVAKPDDWSYIFDEKAIADAGLSYSFDRKLVAGPDGSKDFCFVFEASESAMTGTSVPLKIVSWDGSLSDYTTIYIAEPGEIEASWDFCPMYVSQEGTLTISGIPESQMPLGITFSDPSVASCLSATENSFTIAATRPGNTAISILGKDKTHGIELNLAIQAPVLQIKSKYISANPDGAPVMTEFTYTDNTGEELRNTNAGIFETFLTPVIYGNEFFETHLDNSCIALYIKKLYDSSGTQIATGTTYALEIAAARCPEVKHASLSVYAIDPFADMVPRHYGRIDDYSLFSSKSVNSKISKYFMDDMESNKSFSYEAPVPNAAAEYVTASMNPCWKNTFSYDNGAFDIQYETDAVSYSSGAAFRISQNNAIGNEHSAGRHEILLNVKNRHSFESISESAGTLDVYVHTAIGATADFSYRNGFYKPSGSTETFAEVYNNLMYSPGLSNSSQYIYYMDVQVKFLTDISKVYVFGRMASGISSRQNIFDCLDIVRPSVKDRDMLNSRLFCSVLDNAGGSRINVCGEPFGYRRGIGAMLYRAILIPGSDSYITPANLNMIMLGQIQEGIVASGFEPRYDVHDMNMGSIMEKNIVSRNAPYYFAPSKYSQYRDSYGKGYHVIHFLDKIVPESKGWTNLL